MEPRTGKTKVAIDWVSVLHQAEKVNRVLVIAPLGVLAVWEEEIKLHCPHKYRTVYWDREGRKIVPLPPWGHADLVFVLVNVDAFSTPGKLIHNGDGTRKRSTKHGGRYDVKKELVKWSPQAIILDESHRIKTPSARKTTMIWSLGKVAPYRAILTGTPITKRKRAYDVYSQWKFLNPHSQLLVQQFGEDAGLPHTAASFKAEYGRWVQMDGYAKWLNNKNLKRLHRLLHDESFAITRAQCLDLPPRLPAQIIPVHLTGETAEVYYQMATEMIARLKSGEITEAPIALVQGMRLAQIAGGLVKTTPMNPEEEGKLIRVGTDKLEVLADVLEDLYDSDLKVVLGARFRADISAIVELHQKTKVPIFQVHGGIKANERASQWRGFNQISAPAAFIGQPAASSLGIDLRSSSTMIWYSLTNSWTDFTQFEDRIALSPVSTSYMYLIAKGTVDELIYETLLGDGDLGRAILQHPDRLLGVLD
jgi:SNF2 family DNA or RNA helicase